MSSYKHRKSNKENITITCLGFTEGFVMSSFKRDP